MRNWQLQEAKARLSELIKQATSQGPQEITLRGESAVVVIDKREYDKLVQPKLHFVKFIRQSPLMGTKIIFKRDKSLARKIDL